MGLYAIDLHRTASTTASLGSFSADATRPRRGELVDLILGSEAAAADNPFLYVLQRCTAAGTSTGVVPQPLDPAECATEMDAGENHTVEPAHTAGGGLIFPATASNGIGIATPTSSAVAITAQAHVLEH